jgi:polyamine oxidase
MAGISAGKALTEQGIHDFRIIEHQDRIGGRTIHTNFGTKPDGSSYTVELGTNWV